MQERQQFHQAYLCNRYGGCNSGHSSRLDFTDPQHCSENFPGTLENRVNKSRVMNLCQIIKCGWATWCCGSSLQFLWTFVRQQNFTLNVWMSNLIMCSRTIIIKADCQSLILLPQEVRPTMAYRQWSRTYSINLAGDCLYNGLVSKHLMESLVVDPPKNSIAFIISWPLCTNKSINHSQVAIKLSQRCL